MSKLHAMTISNREWWNTRMQERKARRRARILRYVSSFNTEAGHTIFLTNGITIHVTDELAAEAARLNS